MSARRVLIVEDDFKLSLALSLRMRSLGFEVLQAHDGVQAVSMAREIGPDLVLLDISLPAADGFSVARSIRSIRELAITPMIFITASKKSGLRERAEEVGAADFIEKPFEQNQIQTVIDRVLEQSEQRRDYLSVVCPYIGV